MRFEDVRSDATGDIVGADTRNASCRGWRRATIAWHGKTILQATYAHYSGKFSDTQFARNTNVGSPSLSPLPVHRTGGEGVDFAPGFDLANYRIIGGNFPTANVFFDDGLASPITKEFTALGRTARSAAVRQGSSTPGALSGFFDDFIDDPSAAGKMPVIYDGINFGTFDNVVFRNIEVSERRYQALQFIGRYNRPDDCILNGPCTVQLTNDGNFEGESATSRRIRPILDDYPEILGADRNFPDGRLDDFQRHKVRLWAVYNQSLGRFGSVDLAPIWNTTRGRRSSLVCDRRPVSAIQLARNPGYRGLPGGGAQTLYFDDRGSEIRRLRRDRSRGHVSDPNLEASFGRG